ncbi:hypothetical protein FSOLCH5_003554 [Fusarium solani]
MFLTKYISVTLGCLLLSCAALGTITEKIVFDAETPSEPPFIQPPHVRLQFSLDEAGVDVTSTTPTRFFVDTGSTGIVHPASRLSIRTTDATTPGHLYLSSSRILYVGVWVDRYVWFDRRGPHEIKSRVPVLAVQRKYEHCASYTSGDTCPGGVETSVGTITIMGIGVGRTYDGQDQSTPDKNVLLNIASIRGRAVAAPDYSPGWIIDKTGITVGLTATNWMPFPPHVVRLPLPSPPGAGPLHLRAYGEIPGSYSVATVGPVDCSILIDTGIDYSSMRSHDPLPVGFPRDSTTYKLADGNHVTVRFGRGFFGTIFSETWEVGDWGIPPKNCDITPCYVNVHQDTAHPSFVNTGRHLLRKWKIAFDAVDGRVGFARADPLTLCPVLL